MNSKQHEFLLMIPLQGLLLGLSNKEMQEVLKESIKVAEKAQQIKEEQLSLNE